MTTMNYLVNYNCNEMNIPPTNEAITEKKRDDACILLQDMASKYLSKKRSNNNLVDDECVDACVDECGDESDGDDICEVAMEDAYSEYQTECDASGDSFLFTQEVNVLYNSQY